jgi:hypothetical protein
MKRTIISVDHRISDGGLPRKSRQDAGVKVNFRSLRASEVYIYTISVNEELGRTIEPSG